MWKIRIYVFNWPELCKLVDVVLPTIRHEAAQLAAGEPGVWWEGGAGPDTPGRDLVLVGSKCGIKNISKSTLKLQVQVLFVWLLTSVTHKHKLRLFRFQNCTANLIETQLDSLWAPLLCCILILCKNLPTPVCWTISRITQPICLCLFFFGSFLSPIMSLSLFTGIFRLVLGVPVFFFYSWFVGCFIFNSVCM